MLCKDGGCNKIWCKYTAGWKQFSLVTQCVDFQRVFSFVRIDCDTVFSNVYFETQKKNNLG